MAIDFTAFVVVKIVAVRRFCFDIFFHSALVIFSTVLSVIALYSIQFAYSDL